jgi:hypothetical protein
MKWSPKLFGICLILFSSCALAANRAIVIGGNCEDGNPRNLFLEDMALTTKALSEKGWDVQAFFDGAARDCKFLSTDPKCTTSPKDIHCCPAGVEPQGWDSTKLGSRETIGDVKDASKDNLISALKASADQLNPGDQLLIDVQTHGGHGNKNYSHTWCIKGAKYDGLHVDDADLQAALDSVKKKGVKIAILDQSCYSGGSIEPLKRFGCVISATEADSTNTQAPLTDAIDQLYHDDDFIKRKKLIDAQDPKKKLDKYSLEDLYFQALSFAANKSIQAVFPQSSQIQESDLSLAEHFLNGNTYYESYLPGDPRKRQAQAYCELSGDSLKNIEAFMREIQAASAAPFSSSNAELMAYYFDKTNHPPLEIDFQKQSDRFKLLNSEVKKLLATLSGKYGESNKLSKALEDSKTRVSFGELPEKLQHPLAYALGAHETGGGGREFSATLDGFVFPYGNYEKLVQETISKVKLENQTLVPSPDWDKIQNTMITALKQADSKISDQERKNVFDTRSRFESLSREIQTLDLSLLNNQEGVRRAFFPLKAKWLLTNRSKYAKNPAFRDCADFKLF